MEALRRPVSTYDKDDFPIKYIFKQDDGSGNKVVLDVRESAGFTFKGRVANAEGDTPYADMTVDDSQAEQGEIVFWISKAQAQTLPLRCEYDLVMVRNGRESTFAQAPWTNTKRRTP